MSQDQIARCTEHYHDGYTMYRHSETDETKSAKLGEELPPDSELARRSKGVWEALAEDNLGKDGTIPTYIEIIEAASGPVIMFEAGFIAEQGMQVNLRGQVGSSALEQGGLYAIRQVLYAVRGCKESPHLAVTRVGDLDPRRFIYKVRLV